VVVVAGCLPGLQPAQLNPTDRVFMRMSVDARPVAAMVFGAVRTVASVAPGVILSATQRSLCPSDVTALHAIPDGAFAAWMAAAMSRPTGMVEEYRVLARPWGFTPADIGVPTTYWQGGRDTLVPSHWAEVLHAATPGATLQVVPGDGHFLAYGRWHEVLGTFAAS
jgi:pimeloyl-ACP methyl ester carboxylesterase